MELSLKRRTILTRSAFFVMAMLFCTYFRVAFLLIYPLVVGLAFYAFNWKVNRSAHLILGLSFLFWLFSLRHGLFLTYNLVSFYYFVPLVLFIMASPTPVHSAGNNFRVFMMMLTVIGIVNDIAGIIQYIHQPGDDNFVGIYGHFTVSQNGLSILNGVLFFYYFSIYLRQKDTLSLVLLILFLVSCVLGFYGAGQILLVCAIAGTFLKLRAKNIVIVLVVGSLTAVVVALLMKTISPLTYDYNIAVIRRFVNPDLAHAARKEIAFINYFKGYSHNLGDLLFGSSPGTFNSRTAFMVGSPTYFNIEWIKSASKPYYFNYYAYPLWNPTNTGPYDGFMNQPFSTLLALAGEYGLIVTTALISFVILTFRRMSKVISRQIKFFDIGVEGNMFKFCWIYAMLLMVVDNFMEYPEVIALLLIIAKLSQQKIRFAVASEHGRVQHAFA